MFALLNSGFYVLHVPVEHFWSYLFSPLSSETHFPLIKVKHQKQNRGNKTAESKRPPLPDRRPELYVGFPV